MPKEKFSAPEEIYDIKTLSPQGKIRYLLEVFDLAKDDKVKIEQRKKTFMELLMRYNEALLKSKIFEGTEEASSKDRAEIHNQIMDILTKISLSLGLSKSQRELVEFLAEDRERVTEMIRGYFAGNSPSDPHQYDELHQALRGEGYFMSTPKDKDK